VVEMKDLKEKIKDKVFDKGKVHFLSAQDYNEMTNKEKEALRQILIEQNQAPEEYERNMKALWPPKFEAKPLVWRKK